MPIQLEVTDYFSSSYQEARVKFLAAAKTAEARIESHEHPLSGPDGKPLYTDVVLIGPATAETVLALQSGTHGAEGFAGSAIQTGLLKEGIAAKLEPGVKLMMIHAINPYGFAHRRRVNEDNVDLNRNFVDHSKPYPSNEGYMQLADAVAPNSISLWQNAGSLLRFGWFTLRQGTSALKEAISKGQYSHPRGLFYGGQSPTWSNETLKTALTDHLSNAKRVVFIDFHTGLGPYAHGEVILNLGQNSQEYERAVTWWGDRVKSTVSGESVSVHLQGTVKLAVTEILPEAEVTAVSLEFGTFSPVRVFWALRAENWLQHHGSTEHPNAEEIKSDLLRMFYPYDSHWRLRVWDQGREVTQRVLMHLN